MSRLFALLPMRLVLIVIAVTLVALQFIFGVIVDFVIGTLLVLLVLVAFIAGGSGSAKG